jgi:DNA-binding CsgD family transcriptional regulator
MTPGRERMAELRRRRAEQGVRQVTVWLAPHDSDRLEALRHPGEHDSEVVRRALRALEAQEATAQGVTSDTPSKPTTVTSDVTGDTPPLDLSPKEAQLVALLRQDTPQLTYAEIAAQLGVSESQVKHKATAWTKAGLLTPRPRGGARPRKGST